MPVTDGAIIYLSMLALNFFMLWRQGFIARIIADIFFIVIGIASYLFISLNFPWGIMITIIGGIDLLLTIFKAGNPIQ